MNSPSAHDRPGKVETARGQDPVGILHTVAATLNQVPDVMDAMAKILPRLTEALGFHTAWMFLLASDQTTVVDVSYTGLPPALAQRRAYPLRDGTCHCQDTFRAGELTRAVNIVRCTRLQNAVGPKGGLVFHASVPLRSKGRRLGILNVASPGRELFGPDVLKVLSAVGQQVAVAIERSRLYRQAERRVALLGVLQEAVGRLAGLHDRRQLAEEAVSTVTRLLGGHGALVAEWQQSQWRALARAGTWMALRSLPQPPALSGWTGAGPFGPAGHVAYAVPGTDGQPTVLAVAVDPDDVALDGVLSSYTEHLGLAFANAVLLSQRKQLGAWEERRRLAQELHDAVSQRLFSANLALATAEEQMNPDEPAAPFIRQARLHTGLALREMKQLIYELRPPAAAPLGAALQELAVTAGAPVTVDVAGDPPLTDVQRRALLRIAQEAVQNALRHAPGSPVAVRLTTDGKTATLSVEDRGPGFDRETAAPGLGLRHMAERAAALGATLQVQAGPGAGTRIAVTVPVHGGEPNA
jgi:signal transduction histidine kinase